MKLFKDLTKKQRYDYISNLGLLCDKREIEDAEIKYLFVT